jgi:deoxyribonuclease-4
VRFGFHVSITGGLAKVRQRAEQVGCESVQFFTRSPRGWKARRLADSEVAEFRQDMAGSGISPVFVHAPYLPNLAARGELGRRSVRALVSEAGRCDRLGIRFLVVHFGRAGDQSESRALETVTRNVNRVLSLSPESVTLLLENTAGMGSELGNRFWHLAEVIGRAVDPNRLGVVLDTAHLFQAGYELRTEPGLDATLREFDRVVGMGRLYLLHLNDSKTGFGSRVDRHWHIGKGRIGNAGFRLIVNHPLLSHLPGIMETPKESHKDDLANLRRIRRLVN